MDDVLVGFVQALRAAGLRVSSSEALDAFQAATHTGLRDRTIMKAAMRAALVKRQRDIPVFDEIFDRYFSPSVEPMPFPGMGQGQEGEQDPQQYLKEHEEFMQRLREAMERMGRKPLDRLTEALMAGDVTVITAEMLEHMTPEQLQQLENMLQRGRLTRFILDEMGWQRMQAEMIELVRDLQQAGEFELAQKVRERLWELQELFPKWVANQVNDAYEKMNANPQQPVSNDLRQKEFARFTENEIRAMEEIVDQLARTLREDFSRRMRRGGFKRLDVSKTLRASYKTAGVPMELVFKERRRNKLRLAILCDVSSSVRNASRFMLQLVYSLQQQRGRVRSFVFIADVDEVSEFFERNSIDSAVEMATGEANIRYWAHSDFGNTFAQFLDEYGEALNSRTTIIILGDGRSNFYDPQVDALAEIRQRSRQVVWLNPESQWSWGSGDSIIDLYAHECDVLTECRNLEQLTQVMEHLTQTVV